MHDEFISLSVCQIVAFVSHTLKIVTRSKRDMMCITVKSLGTVITKDQGTALEPAWTWSIPWV